MIDKEKIGDLIQRLTIHRQTLAHYLKQSAVFGTAFTPPVIGHGIREEREQIKHIKRLLRECDVWIEDHPDDEWSISSSPAAPITQSGHTSSATQATRSPSRKPPMVDREREVRIFNKMLRQEIAMRGMIIHSDGEGGWGKSSLLKRFERESIFCNMPTTEALLFTPQDTGADMRSIMIRTADKLGIHYFPRFFTTLRTGRVSYGENVDVNIGMPEMNDANIESFRGNIDNVIFRSPWEVGRFEPFLLTDIFIQELHHVPQPAQIVWLIDTIEQLDHDTEVWLIKIFQRIALGEITKIILIAAGRDPLEPYSASWRRIIKCMRLGPLNVTAVMQLLSRRSWGGTKHERRALAERLYQQAKGKPHDIQVLLDSLRPEIEV